VITIDTQTLRIEEGSWFRGVLYVQRCDVSFDGKYMVYFAMGRPGPETWSGVCRLPWLKTLVEAEGLGASWGGGYFADRETLVMNGWQPAGPTAAIEMPFSLSAGPLAFSMSEGSGVLYRRFERDGFRRLGDNWGEERKLDTARYEIACIGDDGWGNRPSRSHPELQVRYLGYLRSADTFAFTLDEHPQLLSDANWATWDATGHLWVARPGVVERYTRHDLLGGSPSFSLDVDQFEPPARDAPADSGRTVL